MQEEKELASIARYEQFVFANPLNSPCLRDGTIWNCTIVSVYKSVRETLPLLGKVANHLRRISSLFLLFSFFVSEQGKTWQAMVGAARVEHEALPVICFSSSGGLASLEVAAVGVVVVQANKAAICQQCL